MKRPLWLYPRLRPNSLPIEWRCLMDDPQSVSSKYSGATLTQFRLIGNLQQNSGNLYFYTPSRSNLLPVLQRRKQEIASRRSLNLLGFGSRLENIFSFCGKGWLKMRQYYRGQKSEDNTGQGVRGKKLGKKWKLLTHDPLVSSC